MSIWESILIAASLCADCFAVSLCSSVKLRNPHWKKTAVIALSFAIIQTALLVAGWAFGELFVGLLGKAVKLVGFLLLPDSLFGGNVEIDERPRQGKRRPMEYPRGDAGDDVRLKEDLHSFHFKLPLR